MTSGERLCSSSACRLSCTEVLAALSVDSRHGLSAADVFQHARAYGKNELDEAPDDPLWKKYLDKLKEPMIALLLASAVVSTLMAQYDDAISIAIAVLIVVTVAFVQEYKSDESLAALSKLAPPRCNVVRDGRVVDVEANEVVPGDIVLLAAGDRVPADVRLVEAEDLSIDESMLTGETEPVLKSVHECEVAPAPLHSGAGGGSGLTTPVAPNVLVAERFCIAHMGTLLRTGRARGVVVATGSRTELGAVVALMGSAPDRQSPLQESMDVLARRLSFISFFVIGVIFLLGMLVSKKGLLDMFTIGVSLAVAAIPEGLPIVVTVTLALGVQRMATRNAVVRKLPAVEALGCTSVICVDKTGTLTRNEMTVIKAFSLAPSSGGASGSARTRVLFHGVGYELPTGSGYAVLVPNGKRITAASSPAAALLAEVSSVCNNAHVVASDEGTGVSLMGQPTEGALLVAATKLGLPRARDAWVRLSETPFSSTTKCMSVRARLATTASDAAIAGITPAETRADVAHGFHNTLLQHYAHVHTGLGGRGAGQVITARSSAAEPPSSSDWYFVKGSLDAIISMCDFTLGAPGAPNALPPAAALTLLTSTAPSAGSASAASLPALVSALPFSVVPLTPELISDLLTRAETYSRCGLRVLALAKGDVMPEGARFSGAERQPKGRTPAAIGGLVLIGIVALHDPPREGVERTIQILRAGKVRVAMITGDGASTALAIAHQLGIVSSRRIDVSVDGMSPGSLAAREMSAMVEGGTLFGTTPVDTDALMRSGCAMSGAEVEALTPAELARRLSAASTATPVSVFYRTTPIHKMAIVGAFQAGGQVVAMTGDGVNDAPALRAADIGVAMGRSGTDVAKEAADMVLLNDNFSTLLSAIEEGKGIYANIRNFVRFQLSTSIAALTLVAFASIFGLPSPLNAMQILWINIIMDGPPAQSLGVEAVDPAVLERPPRPRSEPIITRSLMRRIVLSAFIIVVGTLWVFISEMRDGGTDPASHRRDTTMTFTTFVVFDMFNALGCRSIDRSVFTIGAASNPFFLMAVGGSLLGQIGVVYFPPLQAVFQTEPLSLFDWFYICMIASTVLAADEIVKTYIRSGSGVTSFSDSEELPSFSLFTSRLHAMTPLPLRGVFSRLTSAGPGDDYKRGDEDLEGGA